MRAVMLPALLLLLGAVTVGSVCAQENSSAGQTRGPRIVFTGSSEVPLSRVRHVARSRLLEVRRGQGGPPELADAAYRMQQWLQGQGYADAHVSFRMLAASGGTERVVQSAAGWPDVDRVEFVVESGRMVYLGTLSFPGARAVPAERLKTVVAGGTAATRQAYRADAVSSAVQTIAQLYVNRGYAKAHVGPVSTIRRTANGVVLADVTIPVAEGGKFTVSSVSVDAPGLADSLVAQVKNRIGLTGQPYVPQQAAGAAVTIRNELGAHGYQARVDFQASLQKDLTAQLSYRVDLGPRLVIDHYTIENMGTAPLRTRERLIRSTFIQKSGDTVDMNKMDQTQERLYERGLFSYVNVHLVPQPGTESPRPTTVVIQLEEAQSQYVQITAGWGSYELLRGSLSFTDQNLLGLGRYWSTTGHGSFKTYGVRSSVSDSVLFGPASTLSVTGSYEYRDAPTFRVTTAAAETSLAYRLTNQWNARLAYQYSYSQVRPDTADVAAAESGALTTGRVTGKLEYDSRDSVVIPTSGADLSISPLYSAPFLGSDLNFAGADLEAGWYVSLPLNSVLALFAQYSTRYAFVGSHTLPVSERLFLGGPNSVRSFGQDELGPVTSDRLPKGGLSSAMASVELRIPVAGSLHGALFYDAGSVSESSFTAATEIGQAVGAGVRYYLPVGPIRVDAAYNPGRLFGASGRFRVNVAVGFSY